MHLWLYFSSKLGFLLYITQYVFLLFFSLQIQIFIIIFLLLLFQNLYSFVFFQNYPIILTSQGFLVRDTCFALLFAVLRKGVGITVLQGSYLMEKQSLFRTFFSPTWVVPVHFLLTFASYEAIKMKGFPHSIKSLRLKSALLLHLLGSCHSLIFYRASPYLLASSQMLLGRFFLLLFCIGNYVQFF